MRKCLHRGLFFRHNKSSIFPSTPTHFWKASKELRPSAGYHTLSTKALSNSMLESCSTNGNLSLSCEKLKGKRRDLCGTTSCSKNFRCYSSKECSEDKTETKSGECLNETSAKQQEVSKDCCSKPDNENAEVCPKSSRPCASFFDEEDPGPCEYQPCPNFEDYCSPEDTHKEKLWRLMTLLSLPIILGMSIYVYTREEEKKKIPRPEFVDVPYLRRIVKPFPWGDGKHTLFHNPTKNPISPHGYEAEDPALKTSEAKG